MWRRGVGNFLHGKKTRFDCVYEEYKEEKKTGMHKRTESIWTNNEYVQFVGESDVSDILPTGAIHLIGESRMVHVQLRFVFGHQMVAVVQVPGVSREPRIFHIYVVLSQNRNACQCRTLSEYLHQYQQVSPGHVHFGQNVELNALLLRRSRFQMDDVAFSILYGQQIKSLLVISGKKNYIYMQSRIYKFCTFGYYHSCHPYYFKFSF